MAFDPPAGTASMLTRPLVRPLARALTQPLTSLREFDADAADHIAAVEAADGQSLEHSTRLAINAFVVGCKADASPIAGVSNWDAIKAICLLSGARTLSGALVPLKGSAPTNVNFVGGDYSRASGLKGDGVTKYLRSGHNNNADPQNNFHLGVFATEAAGSGVARTYAGVGTGAETGSARFGRSGTSPANLFLRCRTSAIAEDAGNGATTGFIGIQRSEAAEYVSAAAGATKTISQVSEVPRDAEIYIYAANAGGPTFQSDCRLSAYSIGEAVTLLSLRQRYLDFMDAIAGL